MMSTRIKLSAFISRTPIPVGIATISAAIITRQAMPASSLRPVNMLGNARGKTTRQRIWLSDPPRTLAALLYLSSKLLILLSCYRNGEERADKTIRIGSISLIPTQASTTQPAQGRDGYKTLARGPRAFGNPVPSGKDTQK